MDNNLVENIERMGDEHQGSSAIDTPMKEGAFDLSDQEKIEKIKEYFGKIMDTLGLDLTDDSLKGTPYRVAKMYVKEMFHGLDPSKKPNAKTFDNKYQYGDMLVEKNIKLYSACEHHFLPIIGKAHVAYISTGRVIGLSKINRIVQYYARRPQVQERLTLQIAKEIKQALQTDDVAVYIESKHLCVSSRGVEDDSSTTITTQFTGKFRESEVQRKFMDMILHDAGI